MTISTPHLTPLARGVKLFASGACSALLVTAMTADASSHREAPMIAGMPALDGTDLYMFRSYENGRSDYVTLIANYVPVQFPGGGPNYFPLDTEALYEIHIDNDGDAVEDITFSFDFDNEIASVTVPVGDRDVAVPLINVGPIGPDREDTDNVNFRQTYSLSVIEGDRRDGSSSTVIHADTGDETFRKPLDNIGSKSIADYETYANDHIYPVSFGGFCETEGRLFVGQRQEGFAVNLGPLFDLVNLNPLGAPDAVENPLAGVNVTSLALEVPIDCLVDGDPVIGAWTTSSMVSENGERLQVSRLGNPLVNEVVIGLPDKDTFNMNEPKDDAWLAHYVMNPTLPVLIETLFSDAGAIAPKMYPRKDLVMALSGVEGLNTPASVANGTNFRSEMLRLNTSIDVTPTGSQMSLGVLEDDLAGFPNGRRPGDDVVDIALRVMMGALIDDSTVAPNNTTPFTDQTAVSDADFQNVFPYLNTPNAGAGSN